MGIRRVAVVAFATVTALRDMRSLRQADVAQSDTDVDTTGPGRPSRCFCLAGIVVVCR